MKNSVSKILVSLILLLVMMLEMAVPAMAVPGESFMVVTNGTYVNVRAGAGSGYAKVGTVQYAGTEFAYLGEANDSSGKLWYNIQYTASKKGWVSSDFSSKIGYTKDYAQSYIEAAAKRAGAVGVQVAVIENGVVTDKYNYGYATRTTMPMNEDIKIRAASISKVVLAMGALRLQEAGNVLFTDSIGKYWQTSIPKAVSLEHLFTHTSTLMALSYSANKETTRAQISRAANYGSGNPGEAKRWYYNNYAIGIAGSTLELAAGRNIDAIMSESFFDPLGIDASFFSGDIDSKDKLATLYSAADGVSRSVETQLAIHGGEPGTNTAYFAGGITISAKDMAKMVAILANDGTYDGVRYLTPESVALMERMYFTISADGGKFEQCMPMRHKAGLYGQNELFYHTGNAYGVLSLVSYNPETRNGVVVITTGASDARDSQGIYDICGRITKFLYGVADNADGSTTTSSTTSTTATTTTSATTAESTTTTTVSTTTGSQTTGTSVSASDTTTTTASTTTTTKFTTTQSDEITIATVTGSVVYIRSGAGSEYAKIDSVGKGDKLQVVGSAKDSTGRVWYAVKIGDDIGFISSAYVKISTSETLPESSSTTASSTTTQSSTTNSTTTKTTQSSTTKSTTKSTTTTTAATTTTTRPADDRVIRLGGASRLETAILVSREGWDKADSLIIANGYTFADSLAGVPLAKALDAPILLTVGKELEENVAAEIERLGARKAYILGGELAVSTQVAKDIERLGVTVERIAGKSRYATAVEIARKLTSVTGSQPSVFYFASAVNYPDALAISTVAAIEGNPILYLPDKGEIDSTTAGFVSQSTCRKAVILGGELAVSARGESSVKKYISATERIFGKSRYDTALKICRTYADIYTSDYAAIATGINFPDALSGGALAAKYGMPIVLVGKTADSSIAGYISSISPEKIYIFGGTGAVADSVVSDLLK